MTRRKAVRWRRLVNRACKAYRRNVIGSRSKFKRIARRQVLRYGNKDVMAWASVWGAFPGSEYCTV